MQLMLLQHLDATNATTTSGDNATGGNNTENPVSKVPLIGQFFK